MAEVEVKYRGDVIAGMNASGTKTLKTNGKHCASDIEVKYTRPSGGGGVIEPLNISENGTYNPPEGVDGYAPVVVNVQSSTQIVLTNDDAIVIDGYFLSIANSTSISTNADSTTSYMIFDLNAYVGRAVDMKFKGGNRQRIGFTSSIPAGAKSLSARFCSDGNATYTEESPFIYNVVNGFVRIIPESYPYLLVYTSNVVGAKSDTIPVEIIIV